MIGLSLSQWSNVAAMGGPAAPTTYLGLAATRLRFPRNFYSGSTTAMMRSGHVATDDLTDIAVAFANFCLVDNSDRELGSDTTTTFKAAIEYPIGSTRQPLLFGGIRNGVAPAVAGAGSTTEQGILISDLLTLTTPIPKGDAFRVWYFMTNSAGIWYRGTAGEADASAGDLINVFETDHVDSGTFSDQGFWCPSAVCGVLSHTDRHSVVLIGDSITYDVTGVVSTDGHVGILAPSLPADTAFVNLAAPSATAQNFLSHSSSRQQLFPYCSLGIIQLGRNDMGTRTAAQVGADNAAIAAVFPSRVFKIACTLIPDTTDATDGFITTAAQTLRSYESVREDYNTNYVLAHAMSGIAYSLDLNGVLNTSQKWSHEAGARTVTDAAMSSTVNPTILTSATASFTSADVGYAVRVAGAGLSGGDLQAWILNRISATQVTLSGQNSGGQGFASTTVSAATANIGGLTMDGVHPVLASASLVAASGIFNTANYPAPV